jgi:uncharacterized protein YcfL
MKVRLLSLLGGLVMLSGAGIAQAADVAQTNTQSTAAPVLTVVADAQTTKAVDLQNRDRVALTDDQMNKVTAGHYYYQGYLHYGWYRHYSHGHWGWHY